MASWRAVGVIASSTNRWNAFQRTHRAAALGACGWLLAGAACARSTQEGFLLESFLQAGAQDVPLNAELVWRFNDAVEPASVHGGGLRILEMVEGAEGLDRTSAGRLEVLPGGRVRFVPDLPSQRDLSDGGLRPNRDYRVSVDGFPRASGVRSAQGQVLESTSVFRFRTAGTGPSHAGAQFIDHSPGRGPTLSPDLEEHIVLGTEWTPELGLKQGQAIVLWTDEPLDPTTLLAEHFLLTQVDRAGTVRRVLLEEPVLRNGSERSRLEIRPRTPLDPDALATLDISRNVHDFGGNSLAGPFGRGFRIQPYLPRAIVLDPVIEEFGTPRDHEVREGAAAAFGATAAWAGDGRLGIRFPRAAGGGEDGPVVVRGAQDLPARVRATTFEMLVDSRARAASPTRVGAQRGIVLRGSLGITRDDDGPPPAVADADALPGGFDLVLVSGGDLVVEGRLHGAGSVLLAAGGAVRVAKGASIECSRLVVVSPAAAELEGNLPAQREVLRTPIPDALLVRLDAPVTYRATSGWIRPALVPVHVVAVRWIGDAGSGRIRVLVRGADSLADAPGVVDAASASPWTERPEEVPRSDRIQFRVELELPETRAPVPLRLPFVDRVEIAVDR